MKALTVLVADDHASVRRSLLSFLRARRDVEIVGEASDGVDVVAQSERLHPDLVLIDADMPGQNGFQATREIKLRLPGTKVVVLSLHGEEIYRQTAGWHLADAFIVKSSIKHDLLEVLANEQHRRSEGSFTTGV
ncbi:MAG: response regulator transcription factor [Ignavibacteria bacterium]|nr:response regulator transcription factor [Ignavibacteria bacterium]